MQLDCPAVLVRELERYDCVRAFWHDTTGRDRHGLPPLEATALRAPGGDSTDNGESKRRGALGIGGSHGVPVHG